MQISKVKVKVDFGPNLREAQKFLQIFVKKEGFWGSEKSSGEGGTLSRGVGRIYSHHGHFLRGWRIRNFGFKGGENPEFWI